MDNFLFLIYVQIALIFILFLAELFKEKIDYLYMSILTDPKNGYRLYIFGDSLYMIGGSVTGAGVYEYILNDRILFLVFAYGIILIILGALLRSYFGKDKR